MNQIKINQEKVKDSPLETLPFPPVENPCFNLTNAPIYSNTKL